MFKCEKWLTLYFYLCVLACILVTLLPWWPTVDLLIIPKYALLFGPRWWLLLLVLPIAIAWCILSGKQKVFYPVLLLLSFNYLDFQLPKPWHYVGVDSFITKNNVSDEVKVVSFNIGGGGSQEELKLLVKYTKPDILLLQEALRIDLDKLFPQGYYSECLSGLCILSKYPFTRTHSASRKVFGGWGNFANFYQVHTNNGELSLANIHLETPRSVLMGLIYRQFDQQLAQQIEGNRQFEVDLVSLWASKQKNIVVAGDFNMPGDENLFRQSFGDLHDSVDVKGVGFNDTKHTAWFGVRIDHILYSPDMQLVDVDIIKLLKGDHRPLMTRLRMSR